ncbi:MAG: hypothetical protein R3C61_03750 [Bacteroidia bacterium]
MRLYLRPYRLLLIFAALLAMVLLLKINKRSFYFHYFKVIEEVEMRNSQELSAFRQIDQIATVVPEIISLTQWIFQVLFFPITALLLWETGLQYIWGSRRLRLLPARIFYQLQPVRAP